MDINATVNLPKTDFPMRAGLPNREPGMLQEMYDKDIYHKVIERNQGKPLFVLHDGPPYANGNIHIGHALNKILKDIIVKHRNMTGYCSPYVPGWDTHGLPIESAILKNKKIKRDELTTAEFRDKCREYALDFLDKQREQFKRLGVLGEWDDPYITLTPDFEAEQIRVFGKMAEKGYIYKGMKPVYWCPADQTALAEAEIEYADDPCITLFVKFPVRDDKGKLSKYADLSKIFFVIWTTTPWTIPGNQAVVVNPEFEYVLLQIPSGDVLILAKELAEGVCKAAGIDYAQCAVLATLKGKEFELMAATHPLFARDSVVLCGEHVTLEAGTGCVHTAPGFGADDFNICQQYDKAGLTNIGVPVPVNAKGVMTDEKYNGQFYAKANEIIPDDIQAAGLLLARENITHSYPHCWRCKNPIIYRATEQWFCSVDAIKDAAIAACDDIQWKPEWGKDRMVSMIVERNDWCISRQRVWGVPIPIFYCDKCGKDIVTPETIEHIAELFREHGSNIWFDKEADELIPAGFVCPHCGGTHFSKETDIMDVWFDSGSTHAGVLEQRSYLNSPADVYLEGGDQYRGWFQSSMLTAIAARGAAPYRQIITHGWTVDGEGKAMHKSLGNAVSPDEVIKEYGADMLRLWVSSTDYTQDVRISKDIMKQLSQAYLKIRNTARYMLGNLCDFDPDANLTAPENMESLDRFALHTFNELVKTVRDAYDRYEFHAVYRAIYNYCVIDLSNFYLDIIKDRLYCGDEATRRSAQSVLYIILDGMTRMLAPILAFTSDEIWSEMCHDAGADGDSVLLNDMPQYRADLTLSADELERWNKLTSLRDTVNKALENARAAGVFKKAQDTEVTIAVENADDAQILTGVDLAALCIVSKVTVTADPIEGEKMTDGAIACTIAVKLSEAPKCPRCWNHTDEPGVEGLCPRCAAVVAAL
ncbi:MAG: isoleucine--tRNA ligase [Oscillospiraceae bacterium]|nr:isoleucine--tRNA ligase [Oscillospiraceae bacterium]